MSRFTAAAFKVAVAKAAIPERERCDICRTFHTHKPKYGDGPMVRRFPGLSGLCARHPLWDRAMNILNFYWWMEVGHA